MRHPLLALAALILLLAAGGGLGSTPLAAQEIDRANRADIEDVQQRLSELGWYRGAIDGIAGPATLSAANAYRRAAGLSPSQRLDKELQLQLHFVNPDLRRSAAQTPPADPQVRRAQELLKLLGYYRAEIDGIEGRQTRAAVREFRSERQLAGADSVDSALLEQLDQELQRRGDS